MRSTLRLAVQLDDLDDGDRQAGFEPAVLDGDADFACRWCRVLCRRASPTAKTSIAAVRLRACCCPAVAPAVAGAGCGARAACFCAGACFRAGGLRLLLRERRCAVSSAANMRARQRWSAHGPAARPMRSIIHCDHPLSLSRPAAHGAARRSPYSRLSPREIRRERDPMAPD